MAADQAPGHDPVWVAKQALARADARARALIQGDRESAYRDSRMGYAGPTTETRRKLMPHAIDTLLDRGVIDQSQASMLDQIARAYVLVTAGTGVRSSGWERVDGGRMPSGECPAEVMLMRQYARWWDRLKQASLARAMPVVVDVAVDGLSLNEISRRRRIDKRTAKRALVQGLACWAEAGRHRRL